MARPKLAPNLRVLSMLGLRPQDAAQKQEPARILSPEDLEARVIMPSAAPAPAVTFPGGRTFQDLFRPAARERLALPLEERIPKSVSVPAVQERRPAAAAELPKRLADEFVGPRMPEQASAEAPASQARNRVYHVLDALIPDERKEEVRSRILSATGPGELRRLVREELETAKTATKPIEFPGRAGLGIRVPSPPDPVVLASVEKDLGPALLETEKEFAQVPGAPQPPPAPPPEPDQESIEQAAEASKTLVKAKQLKTLEEAENAAREAAVKSQLAEREEVDAAIRDTIREFNDLKEKPPGVVDYLTVIFSVIGGMDPRSAIELATRRGELAGRRERIGARLFGLRGERQRAESSALQENLRQQQRAVERVDREISRLEAGRMAGLRAALQAEEAAGLPGFTEGARQRMQSLIQKIQQTPGSVRAEMEAQQEQAVPAAQPQSRVKGRQNREQLARLLSPAAFGPIVGGTGV